MKTRRILSTQERRWLRLKRELAGGFQRGTDRLADHAWLCKNDVTLTECGRLADWIAGCLTVNLNLSALLKDLRPTDPSSRSGAQEPT